MAAVVLWARPMQQLSFAVLDAVRKGVQSSESNTGCLLPQGHSRLETRRCRAAWSLAVNSWIQVGVSVAGIAVAVGMEARSAEVNIAALRADEALSNQFRAYSVPGARRTPSSWEVAVVRA